MEMSAFQHIYLWKTCGNGESPRSLPVQEWLSSFRSWDPLRRKGFQRFTSSWWTL